MKELMRTIAKAARREADGGTAMLAARKVADDLGIPPVIIADEIDPERVHRGWKIKNDDPRRLDPSFLSLCARIRASVPPQASPARRGRAWQGVLGWSFTATECAKMDAAIEASIEYMAGNPRKNNNRWNRE